jgi:chromosome segregation ATPase
LKSIEIFVFKNELNEQLTNDLQNEQKQINSYKIQIEKLTNEIHELEKTFEELKQEKNQLLFNKMDGDEDDERQNLVRQLTQEKVRGFLLSFFSNTFSHFQGSIRTTNKRISKTNQPNKSR